MTAPASPKPQFASAELQAPASRLSPLPSPRPNGAGLVPPSPRFASGPNGKSEGEGLDEWFHDLSKYEATLEAMAEASQDPKFSEELGTIEQWFKVLSEAERTAAMYTLLQHSNQTQIRFLIAVLQQMLGPGGSVPLTASLDGSFKAKQAQPPARSLRPPNLNIPGPGSPATPQSATPLSALSQPFQPSEPAGQDVVVNRTEEGSWANMVNTPLVPMFQKANGNKPAENAMPMMNPAMFPGGMINPLMLNNMGITDPAQLSQLLAMQMMMTGMVPPGMAMPQPQPAHNQKTPSGNKTNNWRSPASARYPGSALRSSGLRSSGLKSSGLKSASSLGSATTPREDEIDPELLKDVPAWLRSLRLHKYTACFEGMTWEDMVNLDDATLEKKGVAALGARRRLLKTFDNVKRKMGMEVPDTPIAGSGEPPASALPKVTLALGSDLSGPPSAADLSSGPRSAAP